MKKIFKWLIAFIITSLGILSFTNVATADNDPRYNESNNWRWSWMSAHVGSVRTIWTNNATDWWQSTIIDTIKNAINRVLWMLSLIALVLCLWWGFQMLTAGWDDSKVKAWTKVLKNAAIWLAVIWLAWLIIAFVFRIISRTAASTGDTWTWTAPYPWPLPEA